MWLVSGLECEIKLTPAQANFNKFFKSTLKLILKAVNSFIDFEIDLKIVFQTGQISKPLLKLFSKLIKFQTAFKIDVKYLKFEEEKTL